MNVKREDVRRESRFTFHVLAFRNLAQHKLRTLLSTLAVALGAAMIIAADVISGAILAVFSSPDLQIVGAGLFGQLDTMLALVSVGITLAAGFLVCNAFLMSVAQRRRQIGMLRALGLTRRQVLALTLVEALLIGGAGIAAGLLAGPLLGRGLLTALKATGVPIFSAFGAIELTPRPFLLAAMLNLGGILLATALPAWQAARIPPLEALRENESTKQRIGNAKNPARFTFHVLRTGFAITLLLILSLWLVIAPPGAWVTAPLDIWLTGAVLLLWVAALATLLPALVGGCARLARPLLSRLRHGVGRLIADNLGRARLRVTLTVSALAVGLAMIVGITGFFNFTFNELFGPAFEKTRRQGFYILTSYNPLSGLAGFAENPTLRLPGEVVAAIYETVGERGELTPWHFAVAPELSFPLLPDYFSFVLTPEAVWRNRAWTFTFGEGDWASARPILESDCALLITPLVAHSNSVALYDTLTVEAAAGPVVCTVAGIGQPFVNASIIVTHAPGRFGISDPFALVLSPAEEVDVTVLLADLAAVGDALYPDLQITKLDTLTDTIFETVSSLEVIFSGLLLLAVVAAALSVVNTTMMSVAERAPELTLLRSIGATRQQVYAVVVGESALMGLIGGALGLVAGCGMTIILVTVYGGNSWGVPDLDLWGAAWRSVQPALRNGLVGLLAAPLICAGAAALVVRNSYSVVRKDGLRTTHYELRLALHNLRAHATRTALAALAVALGVAMLVSTSVYRSGIEAAWTAGANKFAFITEVSGLTFGGVGLMMLGAAGFLIYNAFAMSVTQQQRQIGMLRAVGMTRAQVLRLVLIEALVTGGLGTALGVLGGPLVGNGILGAMAAFGVETGRGSASWGSIVLAITLGLGISLLSALIPARRAAQLSPLEALREERSPYSVVRISFLRTTHYELRTIFALALLIPLWLYLIIAPPGVWTGYHQPWDIILSAGLMVVWWTGLVLLTPALLGVGVRGVQVVVRRISGGIGRLLGDNLGRAPERLHLTALTFAVGVLMLVTTGGFVSYANDVMVGRIAAQALREQAWYIYPFNRVEGLGQLQGFQADAPALEPAVVAEVERLAAGRAVVEPLYMVLVPEISSPFPGFPSLITLAPEQLTRPGRFTLTEGDWETALPVLREGCGMLVSPAIAARFDAGVGDSITVSGRAGPVTCTIAATGAGGFAPMSLIGPGGFDLFVAPGQSPDSLQVRPLPDASEADIAALDADLRALAARYGEDRVYVGRPKDELESITGTSDQLVQVMNGILLLAIGAGALGSVNTTLVSILERQRELTLLRSLGATRRQITGLIVGESAITGLLGALLGLLAGWGTIAIYALTYGGVTFGLVELPLWTAVAEITWPALRGGLPGVIAAPLLAAGAAWLAARGMDFTTVKRQTSNVKSSRFTFYVSFAWRNLRGHALRTALSIIAVALGVATSVATESVGAGVRAGITEAVESVAFITDMVQVGLNIAGGMILVAAGFLIYNAFGMAVVQRRQQIGSLRALGMTRRQVLRLVLVEALLVGGLGSALGLLGGPLLGVGILAAMRAAGYEVGAGRVSLPGLLLGLLLGVGIAAAAALIPARRAARLSPLEALREMGVKRKDIKRKPRVAFYVSRFTVSLVLIPLWFYLILAPPGRWTVEPWNYILPIALSAVWLGAGLLLTPACIGGAGRALRRPLTRLARVAGSLIADNLRRDRQRVMLTALTFAVSVMTIVSITGIFNFFGRELITYAQETHRAAGLQYGWAVGAADFTQGVLNPGGMIAPLKPEVSAAVRAVVGDRGYIGGERALVVPELAAVLVPNYFSSMLDLELLRVPGNVEFLEGDLDSALPVLEAGCGVLLAPGAAQRHGAGVGDVITLQSDRGPLACEVAGVVAFGMVPISVISPAAADYFDVGEPTTLLVFPRAGVDVAALEADLLALDEQYGDDAWLMRTDDSIETVAESADRVLGLMGGLLALAMAAAALGALNTTAMSVTERQRELRLFRAVGATRQQTAALVVGESALTGLLGSALGLIAGLGVSAIFILAHGGNNWGYPDIDLWLATWRSWRPALHSGLWGLATAPVLAGLSAWLVVRGMDFVKRETQTVKSPARFTLHVLGLRERFVLGSAALLLTLMLALTTAVVGHQERYMDDGARQLAAMMARSQAQLLELGLPDDATTLDLTALGEQMDATQLLNLQALLDNVGGAGLMAYTITDRDNFVLLSLNPREVGALAPPLEDTTEAVTWSERERGATWRIHASAPIRNAAGETVGAVRMAFDLAWVLDALRELRGALWAVGGGISLLALALAWLLATPLARVTQRLAVHAAGVAQGNYAPFARSPRRSLWGWFTAHTALRTRFTLALTLVILLLVGSLEVVTLPLQRRHVERTLRDGTLATVEWLGEMLSEALGSADLPADVLNADITLDQMLSLAGGLDWGRLQALGEQSRPASLAYIALADADGLVVFSDQLEQVGVQVAPPAATVITEQRWRNDDLWVISTPLTRGAGGARVGALQMALRRVEVEAFLNESRLFFRLAGVIAALAGVLLAQVVGGAVAGPVQALAAGTRRIAAGDLDVRFDARGRDEVAQLAAAYNAMVAGLREREWLRDMFGRFVSQEVAEALRTGQVRLEGENRVVSVLFCDIRGFTARSERHTPAEIVALLNEYLPVVVEAAQHHQGTVNKFGGDSTLIIYGAPRQLEESAYRAVLTALELRVNLDRLNAHLAARGEEPIRIGVGINTGVALAGAVGPRERQEYTVIGDTVNLASRIEALNKEYPEYGILISGATYEALGAHRAEFTFVDVGEVGIRGKAGPVQIWAVAGKRPT